MAKPRRTLKFRLPEYLSPRNAWRKEIHRVALAAARERGVDFPDDAKISVEVRLYLNGRKVTIHDVDNRLKDILDALQGRAGGSKAVQELERIVVNDRNVYLVLITKSAPPKQSCGLGHLTLSEIRKRKS